MDLMMIKRIVSISITISSLLLCCSVPSVIRQDGKDYSLVEWNGGKFIYVTYTWKGGKFDDAVELERDFVRWARDAGIFERAVGKFPKGKKWELGFIATGEPPIETFKGYPVEAATIPSGTYAALFGKGHPENMFFHWKKLKRRLIDDGYLIKSPVLEIYSSLVEDSLSDESGRGEIRYLVEKK